MYIYIYVLLQYIYIYIYMYIHIPKGRSHPALQRGGAPREREVPAGEEVQPEDPGGPLANIIIITIIQ